MKENPVAQVVNLYTFYMYVMFITLMIPQHFCIL
jgi:hypothetical protein